MPDVSYANLFVTQRFVPSVSKRVKVRYFVLGLRLKLVLSLESGVRVRITVRD